MAMEPGSELEFKAAAVQVMQVLLRSADADVLAASLAAIGDGATDFFDGEPAVLDVAALDADTVAIDWDAVITLLRRYGLRPIGVRGASGARLATAEVAGLASLDAAMITRPARPAVAVSAPPLPADDPPPVEATSSAAVAAAPLTPERTATLVVDRPLRSGQRVYARGGDLVVLAMVSVGAEVIADGSIHVYAPLRGRALAGAAGDRNAQVLTTCMQAELVSVAGIYRTFDAGLPPAVADKPARIRLVGEDADLVIEALTIR